MSRKTDSLSTRFAIAICGMLLVCCGCERRGQAVLQPFVGALGDVWPRANSDLRLTIQARDIGGKIILHCVLNNTSLAQVPVVFDESTLPWKTQGTLGITAITANGKVFSQPPPPPQVIARIGPPKKQVVLKVGDSLEGDVDQASLAIGQLPRDEDIVLVWSFWLGIKGEDQAPYFFGAVENPFFSGIALLKKTT
jgi:hypothetical protein